MHPNPPMQSVPTVATVQLFPPMPPWQPRMTTHFWSGAHAALLEQPSPDPAFPAEQNPRRSAVSQHVQFE